MKKDFFSNAVGFEPNIKKEREPAGAFPRGPAGGGAGLPKMKAKYGRFIIDDDGAPALEEIMNDCLEGKKYLVDEKMHFTKEGDAVVILKYYIPVDEPKVDEFQITGRRRQRKAATNSTEDYSNE